MSSWKDIVKSIVVNHEKVDYTANPAIIPRVLKSVNKAINHVWSKCDWSFKIRQIDQFVYNTEGQNTLPDDFLSFQHTGRVILLQSDGSPRRTLEYSPINSILNLINGPNPRIDSPEIYSVGGPVNGDGNQRSIFLYPIPSSEVTLKLIYQATSPRAVQDTDVSGAALIDDETSEAVVIPDGQFSWTAEIPCIPQNWHESVIEEVAILFRLMDKSADLTAQTKIVVTAMEAMMRNEPHGREDAPRMVPAYGWRMNVRHY